MQQENKKSLRKRTVHNVGEGWNSAIAVAKLKIKRLQAAIQAFETYRDAGEPWPGSEESGGVVNNALKRDARKAGV